MIEGLAFGKPLRPGPLRGAGDGIEPALSAWESALSRLSHGLACGVSCPWVSGSARSSPRLMAA